MTKNEAIRQIRQAKSAHIRWRALVQAMVAGLESAQGKAPVHHKDCDFGQWFHRDCFKIFGHWRLYQDVDYAHELMHEVYALLHRAYRDGDAERAERLAAHLIGLSHSLLELMALFEEEIITAEIDDFLETP